MITSRIRNYAVVAILICTATMMFAASASAVIDGCVEYPMFCTATGGGGDTVTPTYTLSTKQPSATYSGWAWVYGQRKCFGTACSLNEATVTAYSWSNKWVAGLRADAAKVWVYPFSGDWRWTWTSSTGWMAMLASRISTVAPSATPTPTPTPVTCDDWSHTFHFC